MEKIPRATGDPGTSVSGTAFTKQSPCRSCERAELPKEKCAPICDRLDAYAHENDWAGVPIPKEMETGMNKDKVCVICGERITARGMCVKHYDEWRQGRIEHPELGKFTRVRKLSSRKKKAAPEEKAPKKKTRRGQVVETLPASVVAVDLGPYPVLRDRIFQSAQNLLLSPGHVIVTLCGQAISAADKKSNVSA